jgi:hypothetical protein
MIAQGTDGLSRGDQNAGIMAGEDLLSHVPLHKSALSRSPKLREWVLDWLTDKEGLPPKFLSPEGWFDNHEGGGSYVWSPPPAATRRVNSALANSILKRPESTHVVIVPRLMTGYWRKTLSKICDLTVELPRPTYTHPFWNADQHEPLILAIAFPLSRDAPWRSKGSSRVLDCESKLRSLWNDDPNSGGSVLREFVRESWALS